ncbi:MAG: VOC family protein [Acidobacteria bacterium]|nr:VOC family protein [Acidobacteriota bacterium]
MARVVHFEISADEPQRALDFYANVFAWKARKWEGPQDYWLLMTGEGTGIDGGLMQRTAEFPPTVNSIDVPSVDEFAQKILAHGGKVVVPKMALPGVGYLAYCTDTEGNIFGIFQSDQAVQANDCANPNS